MKNLIMYKKGLNNFCHKGDRSWDIERNAFFKMVETLIPIRPRQSRFKLKSHPPISPVIIPCSFFSPYIIYLLGCDAHAPHTERIFVGLHPLLIEYILWRFRGAPRNKRSTSLKVSMIEEKVFVQMCREFDSLQV